MDMQKGCGLIQGFALRASEMAGEAVLPHGARYGGYRRDLFICEQSDFRCAGLPQRGIAAHLHRHPPGNLAPEPKPPSEGEE